MSSTIGNNATGVLGSIDVTGPVKPTDNSPAAIQDAKLKKASQDFEAVFVGMMLKQMRKSIGGSNALFGNSSQSKIYQDMMDDTMAAQLSKTGSFGLANAIYKSLAGKK